MSLVFETDRLALDELQPNRDELFIFELLNEPGFLDNIGDRGVGDLDSARDYIVARQGASYAANGFGLWRVVEKATGEAVGLCGLVKRDGLDDPDVGYAFLERAWGRGLAEEAARGTLAHARGALRLGRIVAVTKPSNQTSMRVLQKIGLKPAGMIRLPGYDEDSSYFISDI